MQIPQVKLTTPLKTVNQSKKLPDVLIYNTPNTNMYSMMTTFMPRLVGTMRAFPVKQGQDKYLWIDLLVIFQKRFGFGTEFLDFARNLSRQYGCEGNIRLKAGTTVYDPTTPPHAFYRKYGFGSDKKRTLRKVDRAIKDNKLLNYKTIPAIEMFYPDNKKQSFLQKLLTKLYL